MVLKGASVAEVEGAPALDDGAAFAGKAEVAAEDLVLVKVRYKNPGADEEDAAMEVSTSMTPGDVAEGFEGAPRGVSVPRVECHFSDVSV